MSVVERVPASPPVALDPMRWWHIPAVLELEHELFGDEAWTAELFWSELANPHAYYLVAHAAGERGACGLRRARGDRSRRLHPDHRRQPPGAAPRHRPAADARAPGRGGPAPGHDLLARGARRQRRRPAALHVAGIRQPRRAARLLPAVRAWTRSSCPARSARRCRHGARDDDRPRLRDLVRRDGHRHRARRHARSPTRSPHPSRSTPASEAWCRRSRPALTSRRWCRPSTARWKWRGSSRPRSTRSR